MKPAVLLLSLLSLTLACSLGSHKQTSSDLPPTALIELMVPPRGEIKEIPQLEAFAESHAFAVDPRFDVGDGTTVVGKMRDAGWSLGFYQTYTNVEAQGGGPILRASLAIDDFSTAEGAKRLLPVLHENILHHLEYGDDVQGTAEDFDVEGLEDGSWGVKTTVVIAGTSVTLAVVGFAEGGTIGTVWIERQDETAETVTAGQLGKRLLGRIKSAKAGKFDGELVDLLPVDVLILSKTAMATQKTFHIAAVRRFRVEGEESSITLDYDSAPGDAAVGSVELPDLTRLDVFVQGSTAFARFPAESWQCLTDTTKMNPVQIGMTRPKFDLILERVADSGQVEFSRNDDPDFHHIRATVDAKKFAAAVPEVMSSGSYLRTLYPGIGAGTVVVDIAVNKADLTLAELDYEMRLSVEEEQVIVRSESTLSEYGKVFALPQSRELPLCAEYNDPPCKGSRLNACNAAPKELSSPAIPADSCDGQVQRVCIVPVGGVSPTLLQAVVERVKGLLPGVPIAVAPAIGTGTGMDLSREQMSDLVILGRVQKEYEQLIKDQKVALIAVTPVDIYSAQSPGDSFVFGLRRGPSELEYRLGVLSYWRLDDANYGEAAAPRLLEDRLTKLVLKYVLNMYSHLPENNDPTSILYNRIYSLDALDRIALTVPAR